jgi:Tfp pilus assembly protein PilF
MKYCGQCGQQLPEGARFCNGCGAASPEKQKAASATESETITASSTALDPEKTGSGDSPGQSTRSNIPPITVKPQGIVLPAVRTRTIITSIIIALLLAAGGFWGWKSLGSEARVQQKLDLAVKYLSVNKFEEAVLAYNDAIKIDSKEVKAYQGLAKTYTMQGKYDEAKSTYERGAAAVTSENKPQLRLGLAGMYIDKGDLQEAERYFQAIISEYKTNIDAYRGLSLVYQQQGNKDKAKAILEQGAKENAGDYNAFSALAIFYADNGDKEKALANIIKSLDLEINQQEAYTILADLYNGKWSELINKTNSITSSKTVVMIKFYAFYSDGKYAQALSQYKASLEQDQKNLKAQVLAAICMLKNGENEAASQLIQNLVKTKTNSWIMADIAKYYLSTGDNKKAIEWADKSLNANEQNMEAFNILAEIYNKDNPQNAKIVNTRIMVYTWRPVKKITTTKADIGSMDLVGNPKPAQIPSQISSNDSMMFLDNMTPISHGAYFYATEWKFFQKYGSFEDVNGIVYKNGIGMFSNNGYRSGIGYSEYFLNGNAKMFEADLALEKYWLNGDYGQTTFIVYCDGNILYKKQFVSETTPQHIKINIPAGSKILRIEVNQVAGTTGTHGAIWGNAFLQS